MRRRNYQYVRESQPLSLSVSKEERLPGGQKPILPKNALPMDENAFSGFVLTCKYRRRRTTRRKPTSKLLSSYTLQQSASRCCTPESREWYTLVQIASPQSARIASASLPQIFTPRILIGNSKADETRTSYFVSRG